MFSKLGNCDTILDKIGNFPDNISQECDMETSLRPRRQRVALIICWRKICLWCFYLNHNFSFNTPGGCRSIFTNITLLAKSVSDEQYEYCRIIPIRGWMICKLRLCACDSIISLILFTDLTSNFDFWFCGSGRGWLYAETDSNNWKINNFFNNFINVCNLP